MAATRHHHLPDAPPGRTRGGHLRKARKPRPQTTPPEAVGGAPRAAPEDQARADRIRRRIASMSDPPSAQSLLRIADVMDRTGMALSTIYQMMNEGKFPVPIKVLEGSRSVRWIESEVEAWIAARIMATRAADGRSESAAERG